MERTEELKTHLGQTAYSLYGTWMKMYKRSVPRIESFMVSRYYGAFIKFAQYIKEVNLPDVESFIQMMIEKDLTPHLWTNDKVYVQYLEFLDRRTSPIKHASFTTTALLRIADDHNIDVSEVFTVLMPGDILQMIRTRQLSPWILLVSGKFKQHVLTKWSPEEQNLLENLIRPVYWKQKFDKNPEIVKYMKEFTKELNI
jgi:hypothetical protein